MIKICLKPINAHVQVPQRSTLGPLLNPQGGCIKMGTNRL